MRSETYRLIPAETPQRHEQADALLLAWIELVRGESPMTVARHLEDIARRLRRESQ